MISQIEETDYTDERKKINLQNVSLDAALRFTENWDLGLLKRYITMH